MYLVAIGWLYVAFMMALAEATAPSGTVIGALFTFFAYGLGPVALILYLLGTPARKARLRAQAAAELAALREQAARSAAALEQADAGRHAAAEPTLAAERKEA